MTARSPMAQLKGWVYLSRPSNSLAATALLLLGAWTPTGWPSPTLWAALSLWCLTVFGYVINDLYDLPADRINKPHRPLVTGIVSPAAARRGIILLAGSAILTARTVIWWGPLIAVTVLAALWGYSAWAKHRPLVGNILIGGLAGAALIAGSWLRNAPFDLLGPATVVALFITGREILKTAEDVPGDRLMGTRTVAACWGPHTAVRLYGLCLGFAAGLTLLVWPNVTSHAGLARNVWTGYLLLLAILAWRLPLERAVPWGLRGTKVGYGVGLLALAVARG